MAKPLATILKKYSDVIAGKLPASEINALTLGKDPGVDYAPKMADEREFVASHSVEKFPDRVGNGPEVYNGANVKQAIDDRHGHIPNPKSKNQYTQANEEVVDEDYEKEPADLSKKYAAYAKHEKALSKSNSLAAQLSPYYRKEMAKRSKDSKAISKRLAKKATTGMDEEVELDEKKDNREYDYEGEMAVTKLKTICRHAEHLIDMMKPNTNLPEWVQSKIVKAEDYISTAHDYLMSEMNEEFGQIDEVTASIDHTYVSDKWGQETGKVKKILDSLEKAKISHSVSHSGDDKTYVTSDHPKFASHMEKLAKKADTYDPKIYVHGVKEEVGELDEGGSQYRSAAGSGKNTNPNLSRLARKLAFEKPKSYRPPGEKSKAENRTMLDAAIAKFMKKGGKIRKEEVEELDEMHRVGVTYSDPNSSSVSSRNEKMFKNVKVNADSEEKAMAAAKKSFKSKGFKVHDVLITTMKEEIVSEAKCNMTEAGKMCEVHGMKACTKENKATDKQPMYGKNKKLLLDKDLQEKATSEAQQKLMAMAYRYKQDAKSMPNASEEVKNLAKTMSLSDLRDFASTKHAGIPKKVKNESASPADTPISFPVTNSREGFDRI